jgi:hypothetical protein
MFPPLGISHSSSLDCCIVLRLVFARLFDKTVSLSSRERKTKRTRIPRHCLTGTRELAKLPIFDLSRKG